MISSPSKKIRPESSGSSRLTQRSSVLLPLPLGPITTSTSPAGDAEVDAVEHDVVAEALPDLLEPDDGDAGACPVRLTLTSGNHDSAESQRDADGQVKPLKTGFVLTPESKTP